MSTKKGNKVVRQSKGFGGISKAKGLEYLTKRMEDCREYCRESMKWLLSGGHMHKRTVLYEQCAILRLTAKQFIIEVVCEMNALDQEDDVPASLVTRGWATLNQGYEAAFEFEDCSWLDPKIRELAFQITLSFSKLDFVFGKIVKLHPEDFTDEDAQALKGQVMSNYRRLSGGWYDRKTKEGKVEESGASMSSSSNDGGHDVQKLLNHIQAEMSEIGDIAKLITEIRGDPEEALAPLASVGTAAYGVQHIITKGDNVMQADQNDFIHECMKFRYAVNDCRRFAAMNYARNWGKSKSSESSSRGSSNSE